MEKYTSLDRLLLKILKIPGALMIVPLFLGVMVNTFFPEALNIGSFTTALFKNGLAVLIGLFFLAVGSQISIKSALPSVEKGFVLLVAKFGIAVFFWFGRCLFYARRRVIWVVTASYYCGYVQLKWFALCSAYEPVWKQNR